VFRGWRLAQQSVSSCVGVLSPQEREIMRNPLRVVRRRSP
jgi:hypothetical protein